VGTSTAVLQYPWSQKSDVWLANSVPAEHEDQKVQLVEAQHCARDPERERVAGKSQERASETVVVLFC
jgi:hypothetical protein